MWRFIKFVEHLDKLMERSLSTCSHNLVAIGALAFVSFPLSCLICTFWSPQLYESLGLKLIGSVLGLGLILTPYWPQWCKNYLSWYWFFTLLYSVPLMFTFFFLMNQASAVSSMSLVCSVFLLVLLVDLVSLSILMLVGVVLAIVAYCFVSSQIYFGEEHLEMFLIILFITITGSTLNYRTAMIQKQRLVDTAATAGMIAHELRTPLLGTKSGGYALNKHLPGLIHGYQLAKKSNLIAAPLQDRRLNQLAGVSDRIIREIDDANRIIDMLLIKAGRENFINNCVPEICSMAECIGESIARYSFKSPKEQTLISYTGDFQFRGSKLLMVHVLFNLIKNALYVIATTQRGEIKVWTESGEKYNYLFFKDTAKGMSAQQLSRLFYHFYTTTFIGTGLGLSFCKSVMNDFGGDIICKAKEGEYTLFILSFPVVGMSYQASSATE